MTLQCYNFHKNNIKERLRPPQNMPMQTRREGGSIVPSYSKPGIRRRRMVITTPRTLYAPKRPDTHCTGGWVGLGAGLDGMENLNPVGIRSPDRPAGKNSLHRLRHPSRQYSDVLVTRRQLVTEEQNQERVKISVGSARMLRSDDPS